MIKFDEKGQAYWDFILENCDEKFIRRIESDLTSEFYSRHGIELANVRDMGSTIRVFLKVYGTDFFIHDFHKETKRITGFMIADTDLKIMNEVIKND